MMILRRLAPALLAFAAAAAIYLSGALDQLVHELMDLRFDQTERAASGDLVVVAIDPASLRKLDTWPWPRSHHAQVIDRLREAGARTIALDIDFSSHSTAGGDAELAAAIARADGRVILPTFRQRAADGIVVTAPLAMLAEHAQVASVTVRPEEDGLVRRSESAVAIRDGLRSTMPAVLARAEPDPEPFYIDYGIQPDTIPTLSYADVMEGRFDPAAVRGKQVIVGATAVELGDKLTVPIHRSLPGVVVQALSFESMVQGRTIHRSGPLSALAVALLLACGIGPLFARLSWRWGAAVVFGTGAALYAAALAVQSALPYSFDTSPAALAVLLCFGFSVVGEVESQARELLRRGLEVLTKGAMLRGIVEDSFDGIAVTDEQGTVEMFNRAAADMLDVEMEAAMGRSIGTLLPLPLPLDLGDSWSSESIHALTKDRPCEVEVEVRGRDSALTLELVISSSLVRATRARRGSREARRRILIFTFRDVTDRKRTEEAQRRAMEEAMAANRAKSEFLANMSHELRTPLNAIIGFSEMIKDQLLGPIGEARYAEYATDIHDSGVHLRGVVNDILDVSRIEAGKFEAADEYVDIETVVASSIRFIERRAAEAGVRLAVGSVRDLPGLRGDERLIKQTLLNVLSNAVKFTLKGGTVTFEAARESDGGIAITIADTGIGISADHLARLGQPFFQADSKLAREREGTGLGLYLVTKFVALHDGVLDIASEPGKGTTVTIRFPAGRVLERGEISAAVA
jgi:PAS domain S-box-containing protein